MKLKRIFIFGLLVAIFFIVSHFRQQNFIKEEALNTFAFVIDSTHVSPTRSLLFYDKEKSEYDPYSYIISSWEGVEVGDSLYKQRCSKHLYIFKFKDNTYKLFIKRKADIYDYEKFCSD